MTTYITREWNFRQISCNEWIIEATTKEQSESFINIKKIGQAIVEVVKHERLNSIQGTVVLPTLYNDDGLPNKDLLLCSLNARGYECRDVELYEVKTRIGKMLRIAKITFEGHTLPKDIIIEGMRREVRPFIPKPLQCRKCFTYGHTVKRCQNEEVCVSCGSTTHTSKWTAF